jgi:hypothetical protein
MSDKPGSDPLGDLQRWLMKAGARSLGRDVADRVRSTAGGGRSKTINVWETATTEPPGDEPPECQWCPICRAARRYRESGTTGAGLSTQLVGVGDTLAGFTRDAFSIFESAMRASQRPAGTSATRPGEQGDPANKASDSEVPDSAGSGSTGSGGTGSGGTGSGSAGSDHGTVVGPGVAWPTVVHAEDEHGEPANEGGDREEGGEPRDLPPDGGGDEQVQGPTE